MFNRYTFCMFLTTRNVNLTSHLINNRPRVCLVDVPLDKHLFCLSKEKTRTAQTQESTKRLKSEGHVRSRERHAHRLMTKSSESSGQQRINRTFRTVKFVSQNKGKLYIIPYLCDETRKKLQQVSRR